MEKNKALIRLYKMTKNRSSKTTIILLISLAFLSFIVYLGQTTTGESVPKDLIAVLRPHASLLKPFSLIDKNENVFTKEQLKGKWSLLFFGYTNCPDICPTTLHSLKKINTQLKKTPKVANSTQVIFVSVDPQRDTPKILKKYTEYFNKEFTAITGSEEDILKFANQFSAAYMKEPSKNKNDYQVSHTSSIFLVDPKMRIVASFSPPHNSQTITSQYLKIRSMF